MLSKVCKIFLNSEEFNLLKDFILNIKFRVSDIKKKKKKKDRELTVTQIMNSYCQIQIEIEEISNF